MDRWSRSHPQRRSPEDPAVGVPAEGLLVLRHVMERAELVLVPGGTALSGGVPGPGHACPCPHSRGLHQAEALARKSGEMHGPWKGRARPAERGAKSRRAETHRTRAI